VNKDEYINSRRRLCQLRSRFRIGQETRAPLKTSLSFHKNLLLFIFW